MFMCLNNGIINFILQCWWVLVLSDLLHSHDGQDNQENGSSRPGGKDAPMFIFSPHFQL